MSRPPSGKRGGERGEEQTYEDGGGAVVVGQLGGEARADGLERDDDVAPGCVRRGAVRADEEQRHGGRRHVLRAQPSVPTQRRGAAPSANIAAGENGLLTVRKP